MNRVGRRGRALTVVGVGVVALAAFVGYAAHLFASVALYPDQKSRVGFGSVRAAQVYDVRGPVDNLSGVNFGWALQGQRIGAWGLTLKTSDFDAAERAGFRYIRVHVRFLSYLSKQGGSYRLDPKLLSYLDWVIKNINDRNMIAVIDLYNLVGDEQFTFRSPAAQKRNEDEFLAVWRILANRYRDYPRGLYFELANEPHRPITAGLWNRYVRRAIAEIRGSGGNNRTRMIVVGVDIRIGRIVHSWDQVNGISDLELPSASADPNIMVTFHYYNPYAFTYQGMIYTKDLSLAQALWKGNTWTDTPAQVAYVQRDFDTIARWAKEHHRRVILGEFGASIFSDLSSQARWTALVRREAEARGMVWIFWDFFSQDHLGSLYNPATGAWREAIIKALLPTASYRTAPRGSR